MSYRIYSDLTVDRIYVTRGAFPLVEDRLARALPSLPLHIINHRNEIPREHLNQHTLFVKRPDGPIVGRCPGTRGHVCCNYLTVDLYVGCNLGCSYCIMRSYLNFSPLTVHVGLDDAVADIRRIAAENADRTVRIGSGETGDSLLLDPIFESSAQLIEALADLDNVLLELKSKTDLVDHLLELPRKGNAVIAFSLNPDTVAAEEEGVAAPVEHRLAAARRAAAAGYRIAFHFDPVIALPEWQDHYGPLIDALGQFSTDQVVWISLGTIRYTPALRDKMGDRPYLLDEFVPGRDGKYRYLQQERVGVYRWLRERLYRAIPAPVYMCMESATVWRKVFGALPQQLPELAPIFSPVRIPGPQRTERTEERTE